MGGSAVELEVLLGQTVPLLGAAVRHYGTGILPGQDGVQGAVEPARRLMEVIWAQGRPAALEAAVVDLAGAPDDADALAAVRFQLRKLLSANSGLAAAVAAAVPVLAWPVDWATAAFSPPLDRGAVEQFLRGGEGSGGPALLRLLSSCAAHPVPVRLLLPHGRVLPTGLDPVVAEQVAYFTGDRLALDQALIALGDKGLIGPVHREAVWVHRVVRATVLDLLDEPQRAGWREAAAYLVQRGLPDDPELPGNWPAFTALWPHAEALLPAWHDSRLRIVRYFGASGDNAAAREGAQRLADACEQCHGSDHVDTFDARQQAARFTGDTGNAAGARDQFAALVQAGERVFGRENERTLTVRNEMARFTGEAGDAALARQLFAQLLPVRGRVSGADHPDTLMARTNLAFWTGKAGDAAGARDLYAAVLPDSARVSGADHPNTLVIRSQLAYWTGKAGDAARARDLFAALVPDRERVLGTEHPDTLTDRSNLAHWTEQAGKVSPPQGRRARGRRRP